MENKKQPIVTNKFENQINDSKTGYQVTYINTKNVDKKDSNTNNTDINKN
jgi:hypothetical protein